MTYQEWYRKYTKRSSHLIAMYKYFSGENRTDEIPMIKNLSEQVVSRYYPDCSEIQVVSNQMSFNEENKKFRIQYEPSCKNLEVLSFMVREIVLKRITRCVLKRASIFSWGHEMILNVFLTVLLVYMH